MQHRQRLTFTDGEGNSKELIGVSVEGLEFIISDDGDAHLKEAIEVIDSAVRDMIKKSFNSLSLVQKKYLFDIKCSISFDFKKEIEGAE